MHSRIAGTGRYLPQRIVTNRELAERVATSDEWIRSRTGIRQRHIAADDEQTSDLALLRGARSARVGFACRRGRRPHHRRDDDAGHDLPVDRVHPAGQARRARRPGIRRAGGVLGFRLRAGDRRPDGRGRPGAQCARRGRRNLFAHPRLERSRHLRPLRRRRRRRRARALGEAGDHFRAPACRRALQGHTVRSRAGEPRQRHRNAVRAHGRACRVQVRRQGAGRRRARSARGESQDDGRHRLADSASGEHPHHGRNGEEARTCRRRRSSRRSTHMRTRRRRRFRSRSTSRCATAAFARDSI